MTRLWALALLPLLAATADDPFAGRVAGTPQSCLDTNSVQNVQIVDDHTIIYSETAKRIWRTGPDGPCQELEPTATLIVEEQGAQLCRGDRFRVRRPGVIVPGPICRFTGFTPYDKR